MKKPLLLAVTVMVVLLSFWLVRSRNQSRPAQAQRNAEYQERLERFQHEVQLGLHRAEVRTYLDSKNVSYNQINSNLDVKVGEEPADTWYCDRWFVYVEFRFSHLKGQTEPLPSDNLDNISIQKIGRCL